MIVLVASNCVGRGIGVLTKELLEQLASQSESSIKIFKPFEFDNLVLNLVCRGMTYFYIWIYILVCRPEKVVILANYFPFPTFSYVIVLMRHPFLLYGDRFKKEDSKVIDRVRRLVFRVTCYFSAKVIVQKKQLEKSLYLNFGNLNCSVLPNPVRNLSSLNPIDLDMLGLKNKNLIIYPSGYYRHKGMLNLFRFIENNRELLSNNYLVVLLFAKEELSADEMAFFDNFQLESFFYFLGSVSAETLNFLYKIVDFGVFPSEAETFGNGLLELEVSKIPYYFTSGILPFDDPTYGIPVDNWASLRLESLMVPIAIKNKKITHNSTFRVVSTIDWFNDLVSF